MRAKRLVMATLLIVMAAANVAAHWEEHDINGQYLFGYSGLEELKTQVN